jgi:enoyl-CoA hydratase/3-hydroxyacyl-CoA dehydrogenase
VDQVVQGGPGALLSAAKEMVLALADGRSPRKQSLLRTDKVGSVEEAIAMCDMARMQAGQTQPNLFHPSLCVDAIQHGLQFGAAAGLVKEREVFNQCVPALLPRCV